MKFGFNSFGVFPFLLMVLLSAWFPAYAQRQEVGLVLSGGGSKGLCHIGVIRALEEHHIPIDYVTGTSMGAIIGGLYAAGYSPGEMEAIFTSDAFDNWLSGDIPDEYNYYFKKMQPDASWASFKFEYDSTLKSRLPTNIVSPVQMDFALMEIFSGASAAAGYDFDSLMVPFRCMAADVAENEPVMLGEGNLGAAVRASSTYPFYFKPITIDGKLLFDGGMYNNFPSDVMYEEFLPDMIIGSKAASNTGPPREDDLLSQIQTMLMENTDYDVLCESSVLVEPSLKRVNVIDFSHTEKFIDSGYRATLRKIPEIRSFLVDSVTPAELKAKRMRFKEKQPPYLIDKFYINGLDNKQFVYVNRVLRKNVFEIDETDHDSLAGKLSLQNLKSEYFKLIAENSLDHIYPQLVYNEQTGFYDLNLKLTANNKKIAADIGGMVSSSAVNEIFLQLQYNHLGRNLMRLRGNGYFGRFYNSGMASLRIDYPRKLPYYFEASFTYNKWNYFKTRTYFFEDETPAFLVDQEDHLKLGFGFPSGSRGRFIAAMAFGEMNEDYYQTNTFSRSDTPDKTTYRFSSPQFGYERNTLDRKQYASEGSLLNVGLKYVSGSENTIPGTTNPNEARGSENHQWLQLRLNYMNFFKKLNRFNLGFSSEVFLSNRSLFRNHTVSQLFASPYQPIPESKTLFLPEYRANNYAGGGLMGVYNLGGNFDWRIEAYIFQPYRAIVREYDFRAAYGEEFARRHYIAGSSLVFHSPLGPISLSISYYSERIENFSFLFNMGYTLFNKKAFQ
ncbi:MAG: patatin-like phospholipase family protein [Bacteroidales bacterium]|nr:patatin-like phospholipase family protein [Bacteroidales bacterium]